jgi:lysophospholipase L1-like esterase
LSQPAALRTRADQSDPSRLGVLAFGDSITNGGGELQWGVALQSWALWVARALGLPFTTYAVDGARVSDVLDQQIALFERAAQRPDARYDLGCLYIGVNDVRALGWDPGAFHASFRRALRYLQARCDHVLAVTAPLDLGRPRVTARVEHLNVAIEDGARDLGALVLDLRDFAGRNLVMADHVHPTAFGQIAIAEQALGVLAQRGLAPRVEPRSLIYFETTRWGRLRGDVTYVYRRAKVSARAGLVNLAGALRPR